MQASRDNKDEAGSRWRIRDMTGEDKAPIMRLFAEVFQQPMSDALWQWKYADGRGAAVVAQREGRIIAHYGGTRRDILNRGTAQAAIQCVDTMVAPRERGTLTRKGPYYLVAHAFLQRYVGFGRPYEIAFGFPNERVMRLGEMLGIQAAVDEIVEPVWPAERHTVYVSRQYDPARFADREALERLWRQMAGKFKRSILGVRNSEYIAHRYLHNPAHVYQLAFVLSADLNRILGLLVSRREAGRLLILDLIGDPDNFPKLIQYARHAAHRGDCQQVSTWVSESHLGLLDTHDCRLERPGVKIPSCVCTAGPAPDSLRNRWWLTTGDAEFK